jgi:hypothetical protein
VDQGAKQDSFRHVNKCLSTNLISGCFDQMWHKAIVIAYGKSDEKRNIACREFHYFYCVSIVI